MAEEEQSKGEPPISRAELMRFLDAHGTHTACPHCGTENWGHFNESALEGAALSRLGGDALVYPDSVLPTIVISCSNCAYLWLVARKQVARWLADHQEPEV